MQHLVFLLCCSSPFPYVHKILVHLLIRKCNGSYFYCAAHLHFLMWTFLQFPVHHSPPRVARVFVHIFYHFCARGTTRGASCRMQMLIIVGVTSSSRVFNPSAASSDLFANNWPNNQFTAVPQTTCVQLFQTNSPYVHLFCCWKYIKWIIEQTACVQLFQTNSPCYVYSCNVVSCGIIYVHLFCCLKYIDWIVDANIIKCFLYIQLNSGAQHLIHQSRQTDTDSQT